MDGIKNKKAPSLLRRVVQVTSVTFALFFIALYIVYYISMQKLLVERENDSMISQVMLSESVIESSASYLPSVTRDWSSWDFTYDYVLGDYDAFLDDYLTEYPFQLFRLSFLTILDIENRIVYEGFYDFRNLEFIDDHPDLSGLYDRVGPAAVGSFSEGEALDLIDTTQIGRIGFVNHDGQMYYLSAYPVLRSDETGPCVGTFIFGRIIDAEEIAFLTADSGLDFSLRPLSELDIGQEEMDRLLNQKSLVLSRAGEVEAFGLMTDLFGADDLAVSFKSSRVLYDQGRSFIFIILAVLALCGCVVLFLVLNLLNRIVVKPIAALVDEVDSVNMDTINTMLEPKGQNVELDNLTVSVNGMLRRIKDARDTITKNNERIYYHANFDALTGLNNRFSTRVILEDAIAVAKRDLGYITVFFFDMDRFKFINDTLGHNAGDILIMALADRLRQNFGRDATIARMGGDEFVIITSGLVNESDRHVFAERICAVFKEPFEIRQRHVQIGISIGSSCYPLDGQDADTLIKNAEIAMFRAKELGDGLYVPYRRELQAAMQNRIYIENKLRSVIAGGCGEFRAFFQPKIDVRTGEIRSAEALIRWFSSEGVINPLDFIPQAEESGLIIPLTWWMIRQCCAMAAECEKKGIEITIAINMSGQVILHKDFLGVVREAMAEYGTAHGPRLDIEIIESTLIEDIEKLNDVIRALHEMGCEISVDDFGTGYSSLSYLNKISIDRIKIDRSFVSRIADGSEEQAIIHAIIAIGKSLHMTITAEGVEEEEQYHFLKDADCDEAQ
ncbi:MAG: EAL domain-containing protein, partial [Oscillospiraceae bacterium]|nr:EAL domain-containing protein [Oscillospiraceae bacterium]